MGREVILMEVVSVRKGRRFCSSWEGNGVWFSVVKG